MKMYTFSCIFSETRIFEIGLSPNQIRVFSMKDQKSSHMVLKGDNCVHSEKLGQMVLKGVFWIHNAKSGHMVLKGVNWVQYTKQKIIFKVS